MITLKLPEAGGAATDTAPPLSVLSDGLGFTDVSSGSEPEYVSSVIKVVALVGGGGVFGILPPGVMAQAEP